jgi:hypothetical protein
MLLPLADRKITPFSAPQPQKTYKFWVECMGNNHTLVKSVIKRRNWLSWVDVNTDAVWAGAGP